ncbi:MULTISPECIES: hypothetical protein [Luteimonas]|nr:MULTISPECIES: hypothetical protein [Luteimonas]
MPLDLLQRLERASREELERLAVALPPLAATPRRDPVEAVIAWDLAGL